MTSPSSSPARRTLAAIVDCAALVAFLYAGLVVGYLSYIAVTGDDLDGPSEYETLSNWLALSWLGLLAAVYGSAEFVFGCSFGKRVLGLRIASANSAHASTRMLVCRWAVKYSMPLALGVAGWAASRVLRHNLPWNLPASDELRFETMNHAMSTVAVAVAGTAMAVNVMWFARSRSLLHDSVAGTSVSLGTPRGPRGFEPIVRSQAE